MPKKEKISPVKKLENEYSSAEKATSKDTKKRSLVRNSEVEKS